MDKSKILKVCFVVLGFFFVLAIIESSIRAIVGVANNKIQEKEEKKQEEIKYASDEQKEKRQIEYFLEDIITAIKEKDYNYIFDSLDETYRECIFNNSINEIKEYMKNNVKISDDYEFLRVNQNGGMYQVLVGNSSDDIYSAQSFSVRAVDENIYAFMFDEYTSFKKVESHAAYSNIDYKVKCIYENNDIVTCLVEIENLTSNPIEIDFNEPCKLVYVNGKVSIGNKLENLIINTNENSKIELTFAKQLAEKSFLKMNILEDDVPKKIDISLDI